MILRTLLVGLFLLLANGAYAQTEPEELFIKVSIDKSKFTWDWEQGTGDMADFFTMKCGVEPGIYTLQKNTVGLIKEMPVRDILSERGSFYCSVVAVNIAGESDPSNELGLRIIGKANKPTNFRVIAE